MSDLEKADNAAVSDAGEEVVDCEMAEPDNRSLLNKATVEYEKSKEQAEKYQQIMYNPDVLKRVRALKNNQLAITEVEAEFYKRIHALEVEYMTKYQPLFDKRAQIVTGQYEPTEEECEFRQPELDSAITEAMDKLKVQEADKTPLVGIPGFWAHIFRNVEILLEMTEEHDFPILEHLMDIKVEMSEEPMGFKLLFYFSPNEFFTNSVLTKFYEMTSNIDPEDPFAFEGPEIVRAEGSTIDWNKGKNVTVQVVKKKQKHKQRGSIRTVSKTVDVPSFFHFFKPLEANQGEEIDEETQIKLTQDFECGQYIREHIVPRAVLYYTGEALVEDEDDEFDEDEEEEEEEDEAEDEDDEPAPNRRRNKKGPKGPGGQKQAEECKQQ